MEMVKWRDDKRRGDEACIRVVAMVSRFDFVEPRGHDAKLVGLVDSQ